MTAEGLADNRDRIPVANGPYLAVAHPATLALR